MEKRKALVIIMASIVMITIVATTVAAQGTSFYAAVIIDGSDNEWDPESDYCVDMLQAGGQDGQDTILSTVCLRYNCVSKTLYTLVFGFNDYEIVVDGSEEHWVKQSSNMLVDDQSGNDGVAPDFAWIGLSGETAIGWEASCPLTDSLQTNLVVHTLVFCDSEIQTSATRPFTLELDCDPTAISSPYFTASVLPNNPTANLVLAVFWLLPVFGIIAVALLLIGFSSQRRQTRVGRRKLN